VESVDLILVGDVYFLITEKRQECGVQAMPGTSRGRGKYDHWVASSSNDRCFLIEGACVCMR